VSRILESNRKCGTTSSPSPRAVAETMAAAATPKRALVPYGLTSKRLVDTAQALMLGQASALLLGGLEAAARGAEAPRPGVPEHGADRAHARGACRAGLSSAEAGHLDTKRPAATRARLSAAAEDLRVGRSPARSAPFAHIGPQGRREDSGPPRPEAANVASQVIQWRDRQPTSWPQLALAAALCEKDRPRSAPSPAHRGAARPRSIFARGQKGSSPCPTNATR